MPDEKTPPIAASDSSNSSDERAMTTKERLSSFVWAGVFLAIGVCMFVWMKSPLADHDATRAKTQFWVSIVNWVWGWPAGSVSTLIGLLIGFSGVRGKMSTSS